MKISRLFLAILFAGFFVGSSLKADTSTTQNIGIFGDSLGDGAWSGMYNTAKKYPGYTLFRHTHVGTGLTRRDFTDWMQEFTTELDTDKPTVAVVMFGANDEQGIRDENRKGYLFKSDGWKRTYGARIDAMYAEFEKRKINVIWLGLPIMRDEETNKGALFLNDLYADKAKAHNAIFVPLIDDFKDADGKFTTHINDAKGKPHLLRAEDGVHFSGYGYELIGEKVYKTLAEKPAAAPAPVATAPTPATTQTPAATTNNLPASATAPAPQTSSSTPVIPTTSPQPAPVPAHN